ncbi:MAG: hypothetical protein ABSB26_04620 [Nitrososphaerales archaeon]
MKSIYWTLGALFLVLSLLAVQSSSAANPVPTTVDVQQHVALAGRYSLFNLDVKDPVTIWVTATFLPPSAQNSTLTVQTFVTPNALPRANVTELTTTGPKNINISNGISYLANARVVEPSTFYLNVPANVSSVSMIITGAYTGSSIFWKDQIQVRPVTVSGSPEGFYNSSYTLTISSPCSSVVKQIVAQNFNSTTTANACAHTISSSGYYRGSIVVLYQYALWDAVAWGLVGFAVVFLLVLPNRRVRDRLPKSAPLVAGLARTLRNVWAALGRLDSHKFLSIFIIISVVMLSLSFTAGPDPRIKVFVIASDSSTKEIKGNLTQSLGNVQILTPSDTVSEFNTMATLGTVQVVVISDYNKLVDVPSVEKYILSSLDLVPLTIVLNNSNYVLKAYAKNEASLGLGSPLVSTLNGTRNGRNLTISLLGSPDIRADILRIVRPNPVGLSLGVTSFELVAASVGLLSFLLVTFGIAFLVSKLIEIGGKPLTSSLVEGVFYSAGVFFFTQAIYMSSSALLGWPLGLHAVTSGSTQVTVLGLFHLGAGNQPRTLAAIIGLAIGAAPAMWPKMDKYIIVAIGALAFFIVADPLTGGTVFYEFALLLTGGPQLGLANSTMISVKSFLNQIGTDAAGWASGNFGISSGEMFYYLGAVPLALVAKLQRSTATLVLLVCGFAACDGIVRVAEMTAYKTEPSMVAGVLSGLVIAIAFLGVSRIESLVRRHFPSRR